MSLKLVSVAALGLALAACASNPPPRDLGRLAFMVGCWKSADGVNLEVWSPPEGGLMFGYATTSKPVTGELVGYEQSRIDIRQHLATYTASPDGQRPVIFTEVAANAATPVLGNTISFENPDHDYPQRITYTAVKDGLTAQVSKLDGSRPGNYAWTKCKG